MHQTIYVNTLIACAKTIPVHSDVETVLQDVVSEWFRRMNQARLRTRDVSRYVSFSPDPDRALCSWKTRQRVVRSTRNSWWQPETKDEKETRCKHSLNTASCLTTYVWFTVTTETWHVYGAQSDWQFEKPKEFHGNSYRHTNIRTVSVARLSHPSLANIIMITA